jgi:hypothetical protein
MTDGCEDEVVKDDGEGVVALGVGVKRKIC